MVNRAHHETNETAAGRGLTTNSSVASALAYLEQRGEAAAVVSEEGELVGVVTTQALKGTSTLTPSLDARVLDVMDWECVRIAPDADPLATLRAYRDASWRSLRRRRPMASDVRRRRTNLMVRHR